MSTPEDANATNRNWGLVVPGRPATPSEGFAQTYHRVGPSHQQKTKKFDNGTCLRFGPEDLVDEFEPDRQENGNYQPFSNQLALIDKTIRENRSSRQRYESTKFRQSMHAGDDGESVNSGETALPQPFDNFRTQQLDHANLSKVTLACGPDNFTYTQVPSRFASCSNMPSIYDLPNKSDTQGLAHPGHTNDTRFGNSRPVGFGAAQQEMKRANDNYMSKGRARGLIKGYLRPAAKAWLENYEKEKALEAIEEGSQNYPPTAPRQMVEEVRNHYAMIGQQQERLMNSKNIPQGLVGGYQEDQGRSRSTTRQRGLLGGNIGPTTYGTVLHGNAAHKEPFATRGKGILGFPPDVRVPLTADQTLVNKQYHDRIAALQRQKEEKDRENISQTAHHQPVNTGVQGLSSLDDMVPDGSGGLVSVRYALETGMVPDGIGGFMNVHEYGLQGPAMHPSQMGSQFPHGAQYGGQFVADPSFVLQQQAAIQTSLAMHNAAQRNMGMQNFGAQTLDSQEGMQNNIGMEDPKKRVRRRAKPSRSTSAHSLARAAQHRASRDSLAADARARGDARFGGSMLNDEASVHGSAASTTQDEAVNAIMNMTDEEFGNLADSEYARLMDDMNAQSRARGDTILQGDMMSGEAQTQVRFNIEPPTPARGKGKERARDSDEEEDDSFKVSSEIPNGEERGEWSDLITGNSYVEQPPAHHLKPAIFDSASSSFTPIQPGQHLLSATRPGSKSSSSAIDEEGRQSEPLRARPNLLSPVDFRPLPLDNGPGLDMAFTRLRLGLIPAPSDNANRIFGELPGSVSRDTSPGPGLHRSFSGRRLFEK